MTLAEVDGKRYIIRYARQDQYPPGTNLRNKARDSVIRFARHHGLSFRWLHDQAGALWRIPRGAVGPLTAGDVQVYPMVEMWRSEAEVIE